MGIFDFFRKQTPEATAPKAEVTRHCFVLCRASEGWPADLARASEVAERVFGRGYSAEVSEGNIVTVMHGQDTVGFLAHMPAPIPEGEAAECADANIFWPNGKAEASQHASHVIVTNVGGDQLSPVMSALVVSRLTLVALDIFDGIGVYWGNANVSNSRDSFESFCEDMSAENPPLPLWLRYQLVRVTPGEVGLYTLGMKQFGLMDLEVDRCTMDAQELFEFVSNLALYLVQNGPVIADGHTVGGNMEERILVHHRPSMIDPSRQVYKIVFDG